MILTYIGCVWLFAEVLLINTEAMLKCYFFQLQSNCEILTFMHYLQSGTVILVSDVNIWQDLTAGNYVNLLRYGLQVIQDYSDAVWGVDDGTLRHIQLSCCTVHLSKKPPVKDWSHKAITHLMQLHMQTWFRMTRLKWADLQVTGK